MFDCPCGDVNWISLIFDKIPKYVGVIFQNMLL